MLGVFAMFYIRDRRIWIWVKPQDGGSGILAAMTSQKRTLDFNQEFERSKRRCCARIGPEGSMSTTTTTTHSSSPETLWQDGLSETGDSRAAAGPWTDLVFFLLLSAGAGYVRHGGAMDYYEKIILAAPCRRWLACVARGLMVACAIAAGALMLYGNDARAEQVFFLKYLFSSQSAIQDEPRAGHGLLLDRLLQPHGRLAGHGADLGAVFAGTTGMLVLARRPPDGPDHIPVSNLYEEFVRADHGPVYLYYERTPPARWVASCCWW